MKTKIVMLSVVFLLITVMACADNHYTAEPGPQYPPRLIEAHWLGTPPNNDCGIALMHDGTIAIASAWNWMAGAATAWLGWQLDVPGGDPPQDIADCYNNASRNWQELETYVQCWGQPVVRRTFASAEAFATWVQIPFCQCNQSCIWLKNPIARFWDWNRTFCENIGNFLDLKCFLMNHGASAMETETLPDVQPLPSEWEQPGWNTTTPVPQHPGTAWGNGWPGTTPGDPADGPL